MKRFLALLWFFPLLLPLQAYAHEAYVLPADQFNQGLKTYSQNPLRPLFENTYIHATLGITWCIIIVYLLSLLWSASKPAESIDGYIKKTKHLGPFIIRLTLSLTFLYAAQSNVILGPEIPLTTLPGGFIIRFLLFLMAFMLFLGVLTEVAAMIGLLIFLYILPYFNLYLVTYANYFGELLVLFLFGSRFLSVDTLFFGHKLFFSHLKKYLFLEIPIVRILYAVSLIYAGISIKFLHQDISIAVYNQYRLVTVFHAPATYIAAGAGLSEIAIGLFLLLGFAQRLTIIVSVIFITLSLLYFRELLWPHLILYGISFSLFINSADVYTLDSYLIPWIRRTVYRQHRRKNNRKHRYQFSRR